MFRRRTFLLLLTLAATHLLSSATPWDASAPFRARAATLWEAAATGHTLAPSGAAAEAAGTFSSTGDDYTTHSLTTQ